MTQKRIWSCTVGEHALAITGSDLAMRDAVAKTYKTLTGHEPTFLFSGWGAELTQAQRAVVENRLPNREVAQADLKEAPQLETVIHDLRLLYEASTPGTWTEGQTSHETVSRHEKHPDYHIADFRHADDASFIDACHKHIPFLLDEIERLTKLTTPG